MKKLLAALVAFAFALSVFAQAPKSDTEKAEPKGKTGVTTEKAKPGKGKSDKVKTQTKADAKDSRKDATNAPTKDPKKESTK